MALGNITVDGLKPNLSILGDTQNFIFTPNDGFFGVQSLFEPLPAIPSRLHWQFENSQLSGFRFTHITTHTDTMGIFKFQTFVNGSTDSMDILTLSTDGTTFHKPASFPAPVLPTDAANKEYVDQQILISIGTTQERPPSPSAGTLYFNTTP